MKKIPLKKAALVTAVIILTLILLTGMLIALLPAIVSSGTVKDRIEQTASSASGAAVSIGVLKWSWSEGVVLEEMRVKDHPDFSDTDLFTIDQARFQLFPADLLKKRFHADLLVSGVTLNVIKNESGRLNIERLGAEKAAGTEKKKKTAPAAALKPFSTRLSLPVDVAVKVKVNEVQARYTDLATQQTISLENLFLRIDAPSLLEKTAELKFSTDIAVNNTSFPGQKLDLTVRHPRFDDRQMDLKEMVIDIEGRLPGITLSGHGSPLNNGFKGDLLLDFQTLKSLANPLLTPELMNLTVSGNLRFSYEIKADPALESLSFDTTLQVDDTVMNGGPIPGGPLGPLSLSLKNRGDYRLQDNSLFLKTGELELLAGTLLSYRLDALELNGGDPLIDFNLGPVNVDLKEIYDFLAPVLPADIRRNQPVSFDKLALTIEKIGMRGRMTKTPEIVMDQLILSSPAIQVTNPSAPLTLTDMSFSIPRAALTLKDRFPETLSASMGLNLAKLELKREPAVTANVLSLSGLDVTATNLKPCPDSPLGITGDIQLKNRFTVDAVNIQDTAALAAFSQTADLVCHLSENPPVKLAGTQFSATIDRFKADRPEPGAIETGVNLSVSAPEIIVSALNPLYMDITDADIRLSLDEALILSVHAGADDLAKKRFQADGRLSLDLARFSEKVSPSLLNGITINGAAFLDWGLSGRLFTDEELAGLTEAPQALKKNLSFINQASVSLKITEMGVEAALPDNQAVRIRSISTETPVSYSYNGKTGSGRLAGKLKILDISSLPGDPFNQPLSMAVEISGKNEGLESISLAQKLLITPLNLQETLDLELTGMDRLLASGITDPLPDILTHLNGALALSLTPRGKCNFAAVKGIPSLSGDMSLGLEARLIPKEAATINLLADLVNVNASEPGRFMLENANAAIRFGKTWNILTAGTGLTDVKKHLSIQVLDTGMERPSGNIAAAEKTARFLETMKTRLNPTRTMSVARFQVEKEPFPLAVTDMELDLAFNDGIPLIPYLRLELFGGTMITAASIARKAEAWFMNLDLAFSGIDTRKAFPEKADRQGNPDTEISGKMAVSLPLTPYMTDFIAGLKMDIYFSHIGKRALERMLYALDPSESNEQIVNQRKLLQKGTPRWIRLLIEDGALSLSGKIMILNIEEDIPPIRRLNISNLSMIRDYEKNLRGILPLVDILNRMSASRIDITRKADIRFVP